MMKMNDIKMIQNRIKLITYNNNDIQKLFSEKVNRNNRIYSKYALWCALDKYFEICKIGSTRVIYYRQIEGRIRDE